MTNFSKSVPFYAKKDWTKRERFNERFATDSFVEVNGVRYIQDEEADMRAFRQHEARERNRQRREFVSECVYVAASELILATNAPVTAPEINEAVTIDHINLVRSRWGDGLMPDNPDDIKVKDVRWAMAQPRGLELFKRQRPKGSQHVSWTRQGAHLD